MTPNRNNDPEKLGWIMLATCVSMIILLVTYKYGYQAGGGAR